MALSYFADLVLRLELSGESIQATLGGPDGWLVEAASSHDLLQFLRSHAADSFSGETSLTVSEAQDLGRLISRAALPEPIASELRGQMRKGSVRLGLAVSPELAAIPWEYAYLDEESIGFLAQHPAVRIHRVSGARPFTSEPSEVRSVFVALADPQSRTYPRLGSCEAEFKSVLAALKSPECKHLKVESLEHATPKMLDAALEKDRFGVFHFIGHGDVKPTGGVLVLEGGLAKQESLVYADVLAKTLISSGIQLVVLSSCTSAGAATSLGVQLSGLGIPAVVGMQTAVSDVDAHLFARTFYSALVAGHTIEEAVYEGRMAIRGSGLGWGAPVLVTSNP
jgi:CHAT domain-containing protein